MAHALTIASWAAIGGAGCLALASLSHDVRKGLRAFPALLAEFRALTKD